MRFELGLLALWAFLATSSTMEMCERCRCHGGLVDCKGRSLEEHLNDTVWEGIINVDEFLMDESGIVHVRPFPIFGARKLSMRHNSISKIEDAAFRFITNLTELDLSYNHLTSHSLSPHIFRGSYSPESYEPLKSLTVLRLSGNVLHSLKSNVFEHLPNLKQLYLDSNPFKTIDVSTALAISSINYLEVLDMASCMLSKFPSAVLHTPKSLRVLNFTSNHFTEIPEALGETHSLEEFVINDNIILNLRYFPKVETLKVLKMDWMPGLRTIERQALSNLTRLEEFHCSHNRHLSKIAEDAFMHPPVGLEEVNTWPPIRKLYISHNDLSYLDVNLLSRWDKLEEIDVQMNPWVCDCENQWMLTTLIPQVNKTNASLTRDIICYEPRELLNMPMYDLSEKKSNMRCLDIYGNQPEKDGGLLISIFMFVLILIPIAMAVIVILSYKLHRQSHSRNFSYKNIINNSTS